MRVLPCAWLISLYVSIRLTLSLRIGASAGFRGCFRTGVCSTSGVSSQEMPIEDAAALTEQMAGGAGGGNGNGSALLHDVAEHVRGMSISI